MKDKFYTSHQVSKALQLCYTTVYRLIKSGQIKSIRFGHVYRVPESELNRIIKSGTKVVPQALNEK